MFGKMKWILVDPLYNIIYVAYIRSVSILTTWHKSVYISDRKIQLAYKIDILIGLIIIQWDSENNEPSS